MRAVNRWSRANRLACALLLAVGGFAVAVLVPIVQSARVAAERVQATYRFRPMAEGILAYAGDYDDRFPPRMETAAAIRPFVAGYVPDHEPFLEHDPVGGEILGDPRLNGVARERLVDPARTVMLRHSLPRNGA